MPAYYVDSGAGGTNTGGSWANAFLTLAQATAAASAGEYIYVKNTHSEAPTSNQTYTLAGTPASPNYIIVASDSNEPPTTIATGAVVGGYASSSVSLTINGSFYCYGMTLKTSTFSSSAAITIANSDDDIQIFESCRFEVVTGSSNGILNIGTATDANKQVVLTNCVYKTSSTANQGIGVYSPVFIYGGQFPESGSGNLATVFEAVGRDGRLHLEGVDLSAQGGATSVFVGSSANNCDIRLVGCKLPSGVALVGTLSQGAGVEVLALDCNAGDVNYSIAHYSYAGNTVISTSKYVTSDGASPDGSTKYSWEITGVNASRGIPYQTPWIDVNLTGSEGAITPYLEILTTTSDSVDTDAEVYGIFEMKSTSGAPILVRNATDAASPLAAGSTQTSGAGYAAWTGADSNYSSYKLAPSGSITPAEAGYMRARVALTKNNTIWLDPQIRGLA